MTEMRRLGGDKWLSILSSKKVTTKKISVSSVNSEFLVQQMLVMYKPAAILNMHLSALLQIV